jgi:DNA-binding transcriptional ArsR family regulator
VVSLPIVDVDACVQKTINAEKVAATAPRVPSGDEAGELAGLFRLLGDPQRVRLLYALLEGGELCVCDLAACLGTPESNVSHSLRLLRTAGVVRNRRSGRMVHYRLDDAHVRLLLGICREHVEHTGGAAG